MGGKQDGDEAHGESEGKAGAEAQNPRRVGRPVWPALGERWLGLAPGRGAEGSPGSLKGGHVKS